MATPVDEPVSVLLWSNHNTHVNVPYSLTWRGRTYKITKVGLHHTTREGRTLLHLFSVTDGNTYFKLQFDTDQLTWRLLEVDDAV
jgi:hypothetical protein